MLTLFLRISAFAASCASAVSEEYIGFCSEMRSQSGFVTDFEAGYSDPESFVGLTRPIHMPIIVPRMRSHVSRAYS